MSSEADAKRRSEVIRLVELDADRTSAFIESIVGRGFTIRGWGITVALALIGVGFDRRQWELGAVSLAVTLFLLFVDVQHTWLYSRALDHSRDLDRVLQLYYASLTRGVDDPQPGERLEIELDTLRYGYSTSLEQLRFSSIRRLRARTTLIGIYGALIVISVAATLAIALSAPANKQQKFICQPSVVPALQYECVEK